MEFRGSVSWALLVVAMVWSAACSSKEQHPPQIGDCMGPASACLSTQVGSGSTSVSSDGGSCGALTFTEPCETCMETNCCALVGLCSNNADCVSLAVDCVNNCTTQSCIDDCKTKTPNGVGDFDAMGQCLLSSCGAACGVTDGGTPPPAEAGAVVSQSCGRLAYQTVACQNCVESGCCDEAEMCASDPDCFLYVQCRAMCSAADTRCIADCQTTNPLGQTNYAHLGQCVQTKCSTQCQ